MTSGFLAEIVTDVRRDVLAGRYRTAAASAVPGPSEGLRSAIESSTRPRCLLVEYKLASPGRPTPTLPRRSVQEFVERTQVAGVVGYSCVATGPRFGGSPSLVAELVRASRRPVLFKDFVIAEEQLECARNAGAAAVLLIARLQTEGLLGTPLATLAEQAHARGLEVLLELHRPEEIGVLESVRPDLVGVNVRDLDTLRMERERAFSTLQGLRGKAGLPVLGLSGVERPEDAEAFWNAGCRAALVGSAVALASDPAAFLRALLRPRGAT